jgi:hypothetical protein
MSDAAPSADDDRLDYDLVVLLDAALAMVADHLTPEQRARLRERAKGMGPGLDGHIERRCSPEVQRALLNRLPGERLRVNPDGGRVGSAGEAAGEQPARRRDGSTAAEGSGQMSGTPTA